MATSTSTLLPSQLTTTPQQTLAGSTDEARRQVLAIGAQAGDAGVKAYQDAQAALASNNAAALAEAAKAAGLINAGAGARGYLASMVGAPTSVLSGVLSSAEGQFKANTAADQQARLGFLSNLGAIEPMLDKLINDRAQARADAAARSGGGGGGSSKELTDAELRTRLIGAATQAKQADLQQADQNYDAAQKADLAKQAALFGGVQMDQVTNDVNVPDARTAYDDAVQARNETIAELARQIGTEAGLDPARVYGVIADTNDATMQAAEQKLAGAQGGTLGQLGEPPLLGREMAAKQIKITPQRVDQLRADPVYEQLAANARKAIAAGVTFQQWADSLDTWRRPQLDKKGKVVDKARPNLVNLIELDYKPAFRS